MSNVWHPIETAPKDGRYILLWGTDGEPFRMTIGSWLWGEKWMPMESDRFYVTQPSHWMALPEPPKAD